MDQKNLNDSPVEQQLSTEEAVLDAICAVFGRTDISIDENFFDLGGHSIHAARLLTKLRRITPSLGFRAVFEAETLKALVAHIDKIESPPTHNVREEREEFVF